MKPITTVWELKTIIHNKIKNKKKLNSTEEYIKDLVDVLSAIEGKSKSYLNLLKRIEKPANMEENTFNNIIESNYFMEVLWEIHNYYVMNEEEFYNPKAYDRVYMNMYIDENKEYFFEQIKDTLEQLHWDIDTEDIELY